MSGGENLGQSCSIDRGLFGRPSRSDIESLLTIPEAGEVIDQRRTACNGLRDEILQSMDEAQRREYLKIYARLSPEKINLLNMALKRFGTLNNIPPDGIFDIFFQTDKKVLGTEVKKFGNTRIIRTPVNLSPREIRQISGREGEDENMGPFLVLDDAGNFTIIDPREFSRATQSKESLIIGKIATNLIINHIPYGWALRGAVNMADKGIRNRIGNEAATLNMIFGRNILTS